MSITTAAVDIFESVKTKQKIQRFCCYLYRFANIVMGYFFSLKIGFGKMGIGQ